MRMHLRFLTILVFIFALEGCAWFVRSDECKASYSGGTNITFDGFTWPKSPIEPVKIGKFTYTSAQAKTLGDAVASLEEFRLAHCQSMRNLSSAKGATAALIAEAIRDFNKTYASMNATFSYALREATSPEDALKKATEAKRLADREAERLAKPPIGSGLEPQLELTALKSQLKDLDDRLSSVEAKRYKGEAHLRQTVIVSEFLQNGVSLNATARQTLSARVLQLAGQVPVDELLLATVIGFADSNGSYLANVDLGLRRAQSVATYLATVNSQILIQSIASGGISEGVSNARRVEVYLWSSPKT